MTKRQRKRRFRPPPLPEAKAHQAARARVARMSPRQARQTFIDSGIVDAHGRLTKPYRTLADKDAADYDHVFELSAQELKAAQRWLRTHRHARKAGRRVPTYCFTPTGIGVRVVVRCACGKERDVSEYDKW